MKDVPQRLIVIGAGVIGVELVRTSKKKMQSFHFGIIITHISGFRVVQTGFRRDGHRIPAHDWRRGNRRGSRQDVPEGTRQTGSQV